MTSNQIKIGRAGINALQILCRMNPWLKLNRYLSYQIWRRLYSKFNLELSSQSEIGSPKYMMRFDLRDRIQFMACMTKCYEPDTSALLNNIYEKNSCFIDAGANIGFYSLLGAAISRDSKIFSFEPLPSNCKTLETNIKLNNFDNIKLIPAALGNFDGSAVLALEDPERESGWGQIVTTYPSNYKINRNVFDIKVRQLDSIIKEFNIPTPDILKIDVEGFELKMLDGAKETLVMKGRRHIIIEICDYYFKHDKDRPSKINSLLNSLGYSGHKIIKGGKIVRTNISEPGSPEENFYFLKEA
jgi:FkbM family methyltransferase